MKQPNWYLREMINYWLTMTSSSLGSWLLPECQNRKMNIEVNIQTFFRTDVMYEVYNVFFKMLQVSGIKVRCYIAVFVEVTNRYQIFFYFSILF